jgi:hypothetical protein
MADFGRVGCLGSLARYLQTHGFRLKGWTGKRIDSINDPLDKSLGPRLRDLPPYPGVRRSCFVIKSIFTPCLNLCQAIWLDKEDLHDPRTHRSKTQASVTCAGDQEVR